MHFCLFFLGGLRKIQITHLGIYLYVFGLETSLQCDFLLVDHKAISDMNL